MRKIEIKGQRMRAKDKPVAFWKLSRVRNQEKDVHNARPAKWERKLEP